jgi:hypothetical protein
LATIIALSAARWSRDIELFPTAVAQFENRSVLNLLAVRTTSGPFPRIAFRQLFEEIGLRDWLTDQVTFFGIPFQNWMIVTLALMLVAALINLGERR